MTSDSNREEARETVSAGCLLQYSLSASCLLAAESQHIHMHKQTHTLNTYLTCHAHTGFYEHHVRCKNHEINRSAQNILLQQETDRQTDRDGRGEWGAGQTGLAVTITKNRGAACNPTGSSVSFT